MKLASDQKKNLEFLLEVPLSMYMVFILMWKAESNLINICDCIPVFHLYASPHPGNCFCDAFQYISFFTFLYWWIHALPHGEDFHSDVLQLHQPF